ncbi:MAG: translocation/assembly module TamB, partial [Sinomicrobium sp.]|nr:translocation/assembly module TamB [Sinomicrobium sp.]
SPVILNFKALNARLEGFGIKGSEVSAAVKRLSFKWIGRPEVTQLSGGFRYTPNGMQFSDLSVATPQSAISGELAFTYDREDLADFVNKVNISARFEDAVIAFDEANLFYNGFGSGKKAAFSSGFSGVLNGLEVHDLRMVSGGTAINGDFRFDNLFAKAEPFKVAASIRESSSSYRELITALPGILGNSLPASLDKLGRF